MVSFSGSIKKLSPTGTELSEVTRGRSVGGAGASAFALDPSSGDLYVAGLAETLEHYVFNGAGEVLQPSGGACGEDGANGNGCPPTDSVSVPFVGAGIAVSAASGDSYLSNPSDGRVYQYGQLVTVPDVTTGAASEVEPTSAKLAGTVNPDGVQVSECEFEYVEAGAYEAGATDPYAAGQTVACEQPDAAEVGAGSEPVEVHAAIGGLTAGVTYHYRLKAANANGPNYGSDEAFETPPPPSIDSATVSDLSRESATLNAKIDPQGSDTRYRVEWGTDTSYGHVVPPVGEPDIGSGSSDVAVSQRIEGLEANRTYHWRVLATNPSGTTTSTDHTFIYPTTGGGLPDNRAYEMVTPPQKDGALIGDVLIGSNPAIAADGSRVIASSIQCFAGAESCNGHHADGVGSPYSFTRTASGWVTTPLAPSANAFSQNTPWGYNVDSGLALFSMPTAPFGEDDFYVRQVDGRFVDVGPNTPPGEGAQGPRGGRIVGQLQAQTADFSHFVWTTETFPWSLNESDAGVKTPYEYVSTGNTQPLLVGVSGGEGSHDLISRCGTVLGGDLNVPKPLSDDGRTVFFTALTESAGQGASCPSGSGANAGTPVPVDTVYARIDGELPGAHTVAISRPSPSECGTGGDAGEKACREAEGKPASARFEGASADGSKAFFTSTQQLTDGASEDGHSGDSAWQPGCSATTGTNGCNLYEYDLGNPAGENLVDVSAGDVSGGGPRVQGVVAISPDGTHVYFVAKGVLSVETNDQGAKPKSGAENLYLFERDSAYPNGRTAFIAKLAASDSAEWLTETVHAANVTPSGRYLVFKSHGNLTADATSVSGAQQVYRYDAQTGTLLRVSIGENGYNDNGNRSVAAVCATNFCSEDAQIVPSSSGLFMRPDPTMSDDGGYVFFSSPVALVPGALDDVQIAAQGAGGIPAYAMNVYEWHEGHVYLISDGRDVSVNNGEASLCSPPISSTCLLGSDASGANVFFATTDKLVGQDSDNELDYYDARVCEPERGNPCVASPPAPPAPCSGEECHGIPTEAPEVPEAATKTLNAQGNVLSAPGPVSVAPKQLTRAQKLKRALAACHKDRNRRRRQLCEARARKRFGVGKGKRAVKRGR